MAVSDDAFIAELLAAATSNDTDIGDNGFRRLTLAGLAGLYKTVAKVPSIEDRLKRLEWIVGVAVGVLTIATGAIINGVLSGRIVISLVP